MDTRKVPESLRPVMLCNFLVHLFYFSNKSLMYFLNWHLIVHLFFFSSQDKNQSKESLFGPGLNFCDVFCIFFSFTGSLAFFVGGDTVISSCTWKRESQRMYYFNLCRIFTQKDPFLWKQKSSAWDFFPHSFLSPPQWETCSTQVRCL